MKKRAYNVAKSDVKPKTFVFDTEKEAKTFKIYLEAFLDFFKRKTPVFYIPPSNEIFDTKSQFTRSYALYNLQKGLEGIFITTRDVLDQNVSFPREVITVERGSSFDLSTLEKKLTTIGFVKDEKAETEGSFTFKGGSLFINIPFKGLYQIDFFGDEVEEIFQLSKLLTRKKVERIDIFQLYDRPLQYNQYFEMEFDKSSGGKLLSEILPEITFVEDTQEKNKSIAFNLSGYKKVKLPIPEKYVDHEDKLIFIPENTTEYLPEVNPLQEGDSIIHEDYGIGIFRGIETKNIRGKDYDFMVLEYANGEKINVSYLHFDKIHKYDASSVVKLDSIGGTSWRNLKKKVKKSLEKVAKQLIQLYKEKESIRRQPYKLEEELIKQFEESFEFVETEGQRKAINDVKRDFLSEKPADRLICGDVGFGKTEVAIRASFFAAINGKQTLVLAPTTVLSLQHYQKFKERLEPFGIVVENLSRLKTKKQTEEILRRLEEGKIDILIGTHKALSDKVKFKYLGLLVIDEEHRFGVKAKEKIRMMKKHIDTIYMSATPIPRTLNMALIGMKNISNINTPPEGRIETKTFVSRYSKDVVKKAIQRELNRNGQVFYVFNRIEGIEEKVKQLKEMFPDVSITYIHGRMPPKEIEKRILDFLNGKHQILVSTSIIETGIDIPTANTLIIERADRFGLAQLYHLRGRVGRGNTQAYCYLLLPEESEITEDAKKRIATIQKLTRPDSGLKVAMEDMKIRGVGNILGVEQSGNVKAVGFDMYVKLLNQTIKETKGEKEEETIIETDISAFIPSDFILSPQERMNVYMNVSKTLDSKDIQAIEEYLEEFYSGLPKAFKAYLLLEKIKKTAQQLGIRKLKLKSPTAEIHLGDIKEEKLMELIQALKPEKIYSDRLAFSFKEEDLENLYKKLEAISQVS